jgi:hypothetical protein
MGKIRLTGATSGYTELQAASAAGNNTITLPTTDGGQVIVSDSSGNVNIDSGTFYVDASNNRVGIGTTSPGSFGYFAVRGFAALGGSYGNVSAHFSDGVTNSLFIKHAAGEIGHFTDGATAQSFYTNSTERARIDSSGRLLVGTSTARSNFNNTTDTTRLQIEGTDAATSSLSLVCNNGGGVPVASIHLAKSDGASIGSTGAVANNWDLGDIRFSGSDGTEFVQAASIACEVDGTPGTNDMPGRLVFSTTADGASSPTERMRITSDGGVFIGKTTGGGQGNVLGIDLGTVQGVGLFVRSGGELLYLNRKTNDGTLVRFVQDDTDEGSISVSGTTVSYNGAHLSRWSQIAGIDPHDKDQRPAILRGTVMSNLDEMCDWIDPETDEPQANEQLNKTKISDVEGDKNVAGIFQSWDDDDDTWVNDFYLAMTGDFVIRIAAGTTVQRGDLLMSAGDGTAKPQDDDIIRSKTIAKVTSTHVTCTYDDGSYCVPCVLMAC